MPAHILAAVSMTCLSVRVKDQSRPSPQIWNSRTEVSLYVPDPDAAGFAARQLATSGRQRFALDLADALTPDGQRMLADFLEDGGGAPEAWLERIHRTGRGHAMDRAMVDFGQSWFARLLRMSAMRSEGSAQRMLPDAMFRNRPAP